MRFFKFEGEIKTNVDWELIVGDYGKKKDIFKDIAKVSDKIYKSNAVILPYLTCVREESFEGVAIVKSNASLQEIKKSINAFLDKVNLFKSEKLFAKEICIDDASDALEEGADQKLVIKRDASFGYLGIKSLYHVDLHEKIIEPFSKSLLLKKSREECIEDFMGPELDRIFTKPKDNILTGHPVHYCIEMDNLPQLRNSCDILVSALKKNNRVQNGRYGTVNIFSDTISSEKGIRDYYKMAEGGAVALRFVSTVPEDDDFVGSGRRIIQLLSETIKEFRNSVLTIVCFSQNSKKSKELLFSLLGNMTFVELRQNLIFGDDIINYFKALAKQNNVKIDEKLTKAIEIGKGYFSPELKSIFNDWYNSKLKSDCYVQYAGIDSLKARIKAEKNESSAMVKLNELVGIEKAKQIVYDAINYYKARKIFKDKGFKNDDVAMHMVFTGNPGTCKTTFARILADALRENGVLETGQLIEVGRSDIIGQYVGWTAKIVEMKFEEALGGVLFIDEAYSLVDGKSGYYGDEAINTIVRLMENYRDELIVIFAGYPDKMEEFINRNPGLRSRIAFHVPFDDYSTTELCQIAEVIAKASGSKISEGAMKKLNCIFEAARQNPDFGNGRYVRNVIEKAKIKQAGRLVEMDYDNVSADDVTTIKEEDIAVPLEFEKSKNNSRIGFAIA